MLLWITLGGHTSWCTPNVNCAHSSDLCFLLVPWNLPPISCLFHRCFEVCILFWLSHSECLHEEGKATSILWDNVVDIIIFFINCKLDFIFMFMQKIKYRNSVKVFHNKNHSTKQNILCNMCKSCLKGKNIRHTNGVTIISVSLGIISWYVLLWITLDGHKTWCNLNI